MYENSWVDRDELYKKVKAAASIPVIDIFREGGDVLFEIISRKLNFYSHFED